MKGKNREINADIKKAFGKSRVIMGITELNQVYGYLKYKWPISA